MVKTTIFVRFHWVHVCYRLYRRTLYNFSCLFKKKSQTTDFINVYSLLFKFSDFNQSKVSTEIFPDAVLAEILPVATSPRIPKSRNHESQDTAWEDLNFEPNGQSRRIGWRGGPFLTANIFFLNLHIQNWIIMKFPPPHFFGTM